MAKSEQKRQKKLAKKKAKAKAKHRNIIQQQQQLASLAGQMNAAACGEIQASMIGEAIHTQGIGQATIARNMPDGRIAFALFFVDVYCLGVKDVHAKAVSREQFRELLTRLKETQPARNVPPGEVRGLVEAAVAYAGDLGLDPHPDYEKAKHLFGEIDAEPVDGRYEFGKDGKPFYFCGPNDDPARQSFIVNRLRDSVGEGNFHFVLGGQVLPTSIESAAPPVGKLVAN